VDFLKLMVQYLYPNLWDSQTGRMLFHIKLVSSFSRPLLSSYWNKITLLFQGYMVQELVQ